MGYSKEQERQNQVLKDLLSGREPEKRVFVGYEGEKETHSGDKIDKMTEIMQDVRMPLFCPKCKKVMKKQLDNQVWMQFQHCFDCQIEFENRLIIDGKYDDWKEKKVTENRLAKYKDELQGIKEFYDKKKVTYYNAINPELGAMDEETYEVEDADEWMPK